jgi:hypothetical protein
MPEEEVTDLPVQESAPQKKSRQRTETKNPKNEF